MPRKASIPPNGTRLPSPISDDGLIVTWVPDGRDKRSQTIDLTRWPGSLTLRQEAANALSLRTGAIGSWKSMDGSGRAIADVKALLRWCSDVQIKTFADFTEDWWLGYCEHLAETRTEGGGYATLRKTKVFMLDVEVLPTRTKWVVEQRTGSVSTPDQPTYLAREFQTLETAAQRVVSQAHRRIVQNMRLAMADPVTHRDNEVRTRSASLRAWLEGAEPLPANRRRDLLLTGDEIMAAVVLLVCKEGFNLSTLLRLEVADTNAGQGESTLDVFTVHLDKPRRGRDNRFTDPVYVDDGNGTTGRVYRLIEEATEPARMYLSVLGQPTNLLLLYGAQLDSGNWCDNFSTSNKLASGVFSGVAGSTPTKTADAWANGNGIGGKFNARNPRRHAAWLPEGLTINFPMLHRTYLTVIHPVAAHNTRTTLIRAYLLKNKAAKAQARETAARGQQQALDRAEERLVLGLSHVSEVSGEINSGANDTATVACKDIEHHPDTGVQCEDNFLMCLLCKNAVATPRHLPRLALLHQALEDLQSAISATAWQRWEDHYLRLHAFLYRRANLTDAGRAAALAAATETDRHYVRMLLGGLYDIPS